jgi:hypothetical protein
MNRIPTSCAEMLKWPKHQLQRPQQMDNEFTSMRDMVWELIATPRRLLGEMGRRGFGNLRGVIYFLFKSDSTSHDL